MARAKTIILLMAFLVGLSGPVWADANVYYCTDTKVAGIKWEKNGTTQMVPFKLSRHTMKIFPNGRREIRSGDGSTWIYSCEKVWPKSDAKEVRCTNGLHTWIFVGDQYTTSDMPGGNIDAGSNIWVAYGSCSKF